MEFDFFINIAYFVKADKGSRGKSGGKLAKHKYSIT